MQVKTGISRVLEASLTDWVPDAALPAASAAAGLAAGGPEVSAGGEVNGSAAPTDPQALADSATLLPPSAPAPHEPLLGVMSPFMPMPSAPGANFPNGTAAMALPNQKPFGGLSLKRPASQMEPLPPPACPFKPYGATYKQILGLMRDALECIPIRVRGIPELVKVLMTVEAWAQRACRELGIKRITPENGKGASSSSSSKKAARQASRNNSKRRELKPDALMAELAELYEEEGLKPQTFPTLEVLEEGLSTLVQMVLAREDGKEAAIKAAAKAKAAKAKEEEAPAPVLVAERAGSARKKSKTLKEEKGKAGKEGKSGAEAPVFTLRCFCQLPETETKMRTMVECEGCREW